MAVKRESCPVLLFSNSFFPGRETLHCGGADLLVRPSESLNDLTVGGETVGIAVPQNPVPGKPGSSESRASFEVALLSKPCKASEMRLKPWAAG